MPKVKSDTGSREPSMTYKEYRDALLPLHVEPVKLQEWVVRKGAKICVVFLIHDFLKRVPYEDLPRKKVVLPKRQKPEGYVEPDYPYKYVAEEY